MKKKISIVIPVYFNEGNLNILYDVLCDSIFVNQDYEYELVFVDDGSEDQSYNVIKSLMQKDNRVKVIKLSRNFGSHTAILAGLANCTGDCATVISADLQDPPVIINQMSEWWSKGKRVVLAAREDREESVVQKLFSNTYYWLMRKFALNTMPKGGFDCFLIDRKVIDTIVTIGEKNTSIMGLILWCGFDREVIYYTRKEREIGKSRWTLSKKIKLFIDSFVAFSYAPIKFITSLGVALSFVGFGMGFLIILNKILNGINVEGWTSLMVVLLFVSGLQMIMMGMIGEYLWRSFDETRKRPVFIIEEMIGFKNE